MSDHDFEEFQPSEPETRLEKFRRVAQNMGVEYNSHLTADLDSDDDIEEYLRQQQQQQVYMDSDRYSVGSNRDNDSHYKEGHGGGFGAATSDGFFNPKQSRAERRVEKELDREMKVARRNAERDINEKNKLIDEYNKAVDAGRDTKSIYDDRYRDASGKMRSLDEAAKDRGPNPEEYQYGLGKKKEKREKDGNQSSGTQDSSSRSSRSGRSNQGSRAQERSSASYASRQSVGRSGNQTSGNPRGETTYNPMSQSAEQSGNMGSGDDAKKFGSVGKRKKEATHQGFDQSAAAERVGNISGGSKDSSGFGAYKNKSKDKDKADSRGGKGSGSTNYAGGTPASDALLSTSVENNTPLTREAAARSRGSQGNQARERWEAGVARRTSDVSGGMDATSPIVGGDIVSTTVSRSEMGTIRTAATRGRASGHTIRINGRVVRVGTLNQRTGKMLNKRGSARITGRGNAPRTGARGIARARMSGRIKVKQLAGTRSVVNPAVARHAAGLSSAGMAKRGGATATTGYNKLYSDTQAKQAITRKRPPSNRRVDTRQQRLNTIKSRKMKLKDRKVKVRVGVGGRASALGRGVRDIGGKAVAGFGFVGRWGARFKAVGTLGSEDYNGEVGNLAKQEVGRWVGRRLRKKGFKATKEAAKRMMRVMRKIAKAVAKVVVKVVVKVVTVVVQSIMKAVAALLANPYVLAVILILVAVIALVFWLISSCGIAMSFAVQIEVWYDKVLESYEAEKLILIAKNSAQGFILDGIVSQTEYECPAPASELSANYLIVFGLDDVSDFDDIAGSSVPDQVRNDIKSINYFETQYTSTDEEGRMHYIIKTYNYNIYEMPYHLRGGAEDPDKAVADLRSFVGFSTGESEVGDALGTVVDTTTTSVPAGASLVGDQSPYLELCLNTFDIHDSGAWNWLMDQLNSVPLVGGVLSGGEHRMLNTGFVAKTYWDPVKVAYHVGDKYKDDPECKNAPHIVDIRLGSATGGYRQSDYDSDFEFDDGYVEPGASSDVSAPYFNQADSRWATYIYGPNSSYSNMKDAGCGPCSVAMVISGLTGQTVGPKEAADWLWKNGYRVKGNGTSFSGLAAMGKARGLKTQKISGATSVANALRNGSMVIAHMGPGTFTKGGHYIVLAGITEEGRIMVLDPGAKNRSHPNHAPWPLSTIINEAKGFYSFSK